VADVRRLGSLEWLRPGAGSGLGRVAALILVAVFIQVTVMPRLDLGPVEAIPNLVVAVVVAIAVLRGVVVGAVAGFTGGFLVELLTPGDSLGVLALAYVAIGAWCGRFAAGTDPIGRWFAWGLIAAAVVLVPVWIGVVEMLRGQAPPVGYLLVEVVLPQLILAPLVALPAWAISRRLLGEPRELEPWAVRPA
jgi:rod shape-determining protein MreD